MLTSLRSRLILASVLWTAGLLALMHMLSLTVIHTVPGVRGAHGGAVVVFAVGLLIASVLSVRHSLRPFEGLENALTAVRLGRERLVGGTYPTEVRPLIESLNALIVDREKAVARAVATAGDLAHGLKTPLALLAHDADRVAAAGRQDLADSIHQQVERMSRQINYHLARARASASQASGAPLCPVSESLEALVRTVSKLYADRSIDISSSVPAGLQARVHPHDLDEILGNLLDNACKWTTSRIVLEASRSDGGVLFQLDDDGPGLPMEWRTRVLERGVRLDETAPGSGLGLAIVRDLTELYGGSMFLEDSSLGGLRVRVILPLYSV